MVGQENEENGVHRGQEREERDARRETKDRAQRKGTGKREKERENGEREERDARQRMKERERARESTHNSGSAALLALGGVDNGADACGDSAAQKARLVQGSLLGDLGDRHLRESVLR